MNRPMRSVAMDKKLWIRMTDDDHDRLRSEARKEGISVACFLRKKLAGIDLITL